ncbi:uncharacterized protein SPPG_01039 [Spizellomyces punctatus DAOM BR117]|uniref:Uncharacterized protein n=1 Tax=Spizellomyces punctatus (strain DAOM BR117) TaxID=645134 RepID=A0A0L0HRS7_SPIPD|nr:uncharacterized protein SPPG_01039 [Spizellomyces punctatus DAOM BR117]KND03564.1 hypothetical protein SPPG_01039 [Spizellomyces punctatus DAOM BR117]|eukprot:XP_016611603.1 hypothetical protein SPPG_01039 [Spizellomyces punctatus DAOM BR117]
MNVPHSLLARPGPKECDKACQTFADILSSSLTFETTGRDIDATEKKEWEHEVQGWRELCTLMCRGKAVDSATENGIKSGGNGGFTRLTAKCLMTLERVEDVLECEALRKEMEQAGF